MTQLMKSAITAETSEQVKGLWAIFQKDGKFYLEGGAKMEACPLLPAVAHSRIGIARFEVVREGGEWVITDYHGGDGNDPIITRHKTFGVLIPAHIMRSSVMMLYLPTRDAIVYFK